MIVTGSKLVLAAGAVNSAVLLLASADHKHPRGVPNSSDQVGRNRMIHNKADIVAIRRQPSQRRYLPEDPVDQ